MWSPPKVFIGGTMLGVAALRLVIFRRPEYLAYVKKCLTDQMPASSR